MDIFILIICILLLFTGFLGCFLPVLPGPPICLLSILLIKITQFGNNVSWYWASAFAVIILIMTLLEYLLQAWGAKKFGGSTAGIVGAVAGTIIGLFFLPFGIILCPFLGAFAAEIITGSSAKKSLKSAFGTFVGFLCATGLKVIVCLWIAVYFVFAIL
ncbi:MAG: DUF456 domain-containing protein [Endomicrobium sp.]|jgi:uncharacterized protein YqgC (DUF456 family)|nr:DUF456 domain-containing protein [Endomicrobium sp.]